MSPRPRLARSFRHKPVILAVLVAIGVTGAWVAPLWFQAQSRELVSRARVALARGEVREAEALSNRALRRSSRYAPALVLAGELAAQAGREREAIAFYERVPDDAGREKVVALGAAGDLYLALGRTAEAERCFREVLNRDPGQIEAHRRLAALLVAHGRRWESAPHLFELVRRRQYSIHDLALLANLESLYELDEELERQLAAVPDDPRPLLGKARIALFKQQFREAEEFLAPILAGYPAHLEAQISLGKCLVERASEDEFLRWHAGLPADAKNHPDLWAVHGRWAQDRGQNDVAVRCYWEAVKRNANHLKANYQLAQLLIAAGRDQLAAPFLRRAELLELYVVTVNPIRFNGVEVEFNTLLKAAKLAEELGRPWEAWAWHNAAVAFRPGFATAERERVRIQKTLTNDTPQVLRSANPALSADLSSYPLPDWGIDGTKPPSRSGPPQTSSKLAFRDEAEAAGIPFQYENGGKVEGGIQLHQTLGGGIGVIDYDLDGWPDLHLVQGGTWPADENTSVDCLYRNLGTGRFKDVTAFAGVDNNGFGQGVAVGDVDGDGFPDLYVANIGENRLYPNNGDGTFREISRSANLAGSHWTTSVLIADLNGDALPDIYEAAYIADPRAFHQLCYNREHDLYRSCPPNRFAAEHDRLHLNLGDGMFEDISSEAGILAPDGRGLGLVAADLRGVGRLDLLVANDMTANFFFLNKTMSPGTAPRFEDQGYFSGLALDFDGATQASMGIAADDFDGDGLLDFFVTNFYNESNTLYVQQRPGLFIDATRQAGLREPSLPLLGFGTQFIDAELDGWPDLVVTNGHIDDFRHTKIPLSMPPQFFSNIGGTGFRERSAAELGTFFERAALGRALARIDWNRDGLEDIVVSHLDVPVSLVTNRTENPGGSIGVRLRATTSARDAIGTTVRMTAGDRTIVKQLTAGDGYFVSNERRLVFGIGRNPGPFTMDVRWPSGVNQSFQIERDLTELLVVEGLDRPLILP